VKDIDPEVEFTIGGSYRRGAAKCGDIDFMITKPDDEIDELRLFLKKLLAKMKKTGYHKCTLTISISSRWSGGCALPSQYLKQMGYHSDWNRCRRVDFLLVPWKERGAAFIYFTGNNDFNKKIRLRALKRGMVLNGNGLFKRTLPTQKGGEKTLTLLEGFDEKKIFEILDVRWREPWERNLGSYEPIGKASRKLGVKSKKI
jgi:DNA polymerase IV